MRSSGSFTRWRSSLKGYLPSLGKGADPPCLTTISAIYSCPFSKELFERAGNTVDTTRGRGLTSHPMDATRPKEIIDRTKVKSINFGISAAKDNFPTPFGNFVDLRIFWPWWKGLLTCRQYRMRHTGPGCTYVPSDERRLWSFSLVLQPYKALCIKPPKSVIDLGQEWIQSCNERQATEAGSKG